MSRPKRILLLSLKAGAGHIRAAEAIQEAILERGEDCVVRHIEALEYMTGFFRWTFSHVYGAMIRAAPSLWRVIYERTERRPSDTVMNQLCNAINRVNAARLLKEVRDFDADCIVCTHFIPAGLLARLRRQNRLRASVCVAITDYALHAAWQHEGVDQYCVATDEMAHAIRSGGPGAVPVAATGIPIVAAFRRSYPHKEVLRRQLQINPRRRTVLLTTGGCGLGRLDEMAALLAREFPEAQFLTVAGNNKKLLAALQALAANSGGRIVPLGFVNNLHEIMAASDLAVTKPGGLTSSECLALGLPMILIDPIPGQEERNASFLLENGAAVRAQHAPNLIHKVGKLLQDGGLRESISARARLAAKPDAALAVASTALRLAAAAHSALPINFGRLELSTPKACC